VDDERTVGDDAGRQLITVADVRAACARLPEPGHVTVLELPDPRPAAILVPVVDLHGHAAVVVTKRHTGLRAHGDDWVFPGGRVEADDPSSAEAARREAAEELGIRLDSIELIGQLDTHGPILGGYLVDVFVAVVHEAADLSPDAREVSDIAIVPLAAFLDPGNAFLAGAASTFELPATVQTAGTFELSAQLRWYRIRDGEHLWGMQGNILHGLLQHLTSGEHRLGD
jgi:8-oxo-dGTP pyrophosphatase MutT (NUDIX family)